LEKAKEAKAQGSKRFCMGAAWRQPSERDFPKVLEIVQAVKALGLETCMTLGMLTTEQANQLKTAGLDYYNHNLDTSPEYYEKIISTRTYQERLDTLENVAQAGINVCCGGIVGMGETRLDRVRFLLQLLSLSKPPASIPINQLIPIPGTPLAQVQKIDVFEFVKTIAITRILFPTSKVRIAAGRENMSDEMQAWCFMAGANSIFYGEKLLTSKNPDEDHDLQLLTSLGLQTSTTAEAAAHC
jgi:biotin synthase